MNKFAKIVLALFITALFITCSTVFADGSLENISAYINNSNIMYNNDKLDMDNILYNDVLYVPLRAVTKLFDKEIAYDSKTKSVVILDKQMEVNKNGNIVHRKISIVYNVLHLFSISFIASGLLLLAQMVLFRSRKDLTKLIKSHPGSYIENANKRLIYDSWLAKISLGYIGAGVFLNLVSDEPYAMNLWIVLTVCGISTMLLLLFGWRKCKNESDIQI